MKETYSELKTRNDKALNDFDGIFFAFSEKQLKEGMERFGLDIKSDTDKLIRTACGGLVLKSRHEEYEGLLKTYSDELDKALKDKEFLYDALVYELNNHEFCITCDVEPALSRLRLEKKDVDQEVLKKAMKATSTEY